MFTDTTVRKKPIPSSLKVSYRIANVKKKLILLEKV